LKSQGIEVLGFFYNHNIHPYQEYRKRLEAVHQMATHEGIGMVYRNEYDLERFLKATAEQPAERCRYCYFSRLTAAAAAARENGCDAFSSSLLYSRYQNHELIREMGEQLAEQYVVRFYYEDFRRGWQQGIALSKEIGLYRQQYCGCIYSEKDRYAPKESTVGGTAP
jgi:epoxyqueuosine reductase